MREHHTLPRRARHLYQLARERRAIRERGLYRILPRSRAYSVWEVEEQPQHLVI